MSNLQDPKKLKLSGVNVVFYTSVEEAEKKGFKPSITIALNEEQVKTVNEFWAENKVGKNGDPKKGESPIKPYTNEITGTTTQQLTLKFTPKTQWAGLNGLGQNDMGYGATVNLIASAFPYSIYGGGVGVNINAVVLTKSANSSNDGDLNELMEDLGETVEVDEASLPF